MNSIIENILTRRSIRTFRGTQISEEDLNTILTAEAMRLTGWEHRAGSLQSFKKPVYLQK